MFRQNRALSSIFRQNQALSGKIRGMILHDLPCFHMILRDPFGDQEPRSISTDGKKKLQVNKDSNTKVASGEGGA